MSVKLEEILNLHRVYLSSKSSQRKNLWVLWFHFYHNNVQLEWLYRLHEDMSHGEKAGAEAQISGQLYWASLMTSYGSLGTKGCSPDREGEIRVESYPIASLCESCRSHTVLSIHGSNQISTVSLQVQTQADWKTNKNRLCIRIQGIRVSSWAPVCYRCLSCVLWVYVA